jgi:ubiquitin-like-conjugating enzyme ATG10
MAHHNDYRHWPFVTQEEFELACHFFDQIYLRAKLGSSRKTFKIRLHRTMTTGQTYIEILRLLQPPDNDDELSLALSQLGTDESSHLVLSTGMMIDEDGDKVWEQSWRRVVCKALTFAKGSTSNCKR